MNKPIEVTVLVRKGTCIHEIAKMLKDKKWRIGLCQMCVKYRDHACKNKYDWLTRKIKRYNSQNYTPIKLYEHNYLDHAIRLPQKSETDLWLERNCFHCQHMCPISKFCDQVGNFQENIVQMRLNQGVKLCNYFKCKEGDHP